MVPEDDLPFDYDPDIGADFTFLEQTVASRVPLLGKYVHQKLGVVPQSLISQHHALNERLLKLELIFIDPPEGLLIVLLLKYNELSIDTAQDIGYLRSFVTSTYRAIGFINCKSSLAF